MVYPTSRGPSTRYGPFTNSKSCLEPAARGSALADHPGACVGSGSPVARGAARLEETRAPDNQGCATCGTRYSIGQLIGYPLALMIVCGKRHDLMSSSLSLRFPSAKLRNQVATATSLIEFLVGIFLLTIVWRVLAFPGRF